ncbi:MAG: (Fe-S)-binding protein [Chloroflexota bacterium]
MIEAIPLYPLAAVVFLGAGLLFVLQMARHLRVFAVVRPSAVGDQPKARFVSFVRYSLLQVRLMREPGAGIMHAIIFWGFIVLSIGAFDRIFFGVVDTVTRDLLGGWVWRSLLVAQNVVMVAVLAAITVAIFRRVVLRPRRVTLSRDGLLILALIGAVVLTELLAEALRIASRGDPDAAWAFAANTLAVPLSAFSGSASLDPIAIGYSVAFWANVLVISFFLAYLPRSKHLHIATAVFNTAFGKLQPRGQLPAMDLEAEDATFGVKTIADLGWKDLLDGFSCTECGRCQDACPAWATGKPLNPKTMIMGLREMSVEAEAGVSLIPWIKPAGGKDAISEQARKEPIVDAAIPYDAVWDCVTCGACVEACPVIIEHVDKIVGLRRNLVLEESRFPGELTGAFTAMERHGNPWGQPASTRLDWTRGLAFDVPVAADVAAQGGDAMAELECLYWVGCAAAFDERNRRVARAVVTCLEAAGVRYAVLGQEETCSGDPARRMGNEYVFQMLASANIETLDGYGVTRILTACPHCFNTMGNEYSQLGGDYEVVHHSTFLAGLAESGRLRIGEGEDRLLTYHDPCYLSRYNGITADPRKVLNVIPGVELTEMEHSGRDTFCCGAGGGRMWMEEDRGTRINAERTRQALETEAEGIATACPYCLVMMSDGLADAGPRAAAVGARDIAEIMADALVPDTLTQ